MESNGASSSNIFGRSSRKRRSSPIPIFSNDQHGNRDETAGQNLESRENDSFQRLRRLESENQELKSQVKTLQQHYEQVLLYNRDLESRIKRLEDRFHHTGPMNVEKSQRINGSERFSQKMESKNPDIDLLIKDFEERCDLVESNNQTLTERLDSCQQIFSKMRVKTEGFENQLTTLQQRLNNFEIHDTDMQQNEAISTQQTSSIVNENKSDGENDSCNLVEKALCTPYENQIELSTDDVQYGVFGVCDKYNVIILKEGDKLKLFDYEKQIDVRCWGLFGTSNYATCIHWCSFLESFLILYRFGLHTLQLKVDPKTSKMKLGELKDISCIRSYSLKCGKTTETDPVKEILRFITTSPNVPGYMYLNRGYRRLELINTDSWKMKRGWSKIDLEYGERDRIKTITFSNDGTYIAMNIDWNERLKFVDLRKHDDQMSLMKRIRASDDSVPYSLGAQISFSSEQWIVIDDENQCYKVSANPDDESIIPIRTDRVSALENVKIRLCFISNYILVGLVIGNHREKHGVFQFYKIPA